MDVPALSTRAKNPPHPYKGDAFHFCSEPGVHGKFSMRDPYFYLSGKSMQSKGKKDRNPKTAMYTCSPWTL